MKVGADLTALRGSLPALLFFQGFVVVLAERFDFTRRETCTETLEFWIRQDMVDVEFGKNVLEEWCQKVGFECVLWECGRGRMDFVFLKSEADARASSVSTLGDVWSVLLKIESWSRVVVAILMVKIRGRPKIKGLESG